MHSDEGIVIVPINFLSAENSKYISFSCISDHVVAAEYVKYDLERNNENAE